MLAEPCVSAWMLLIVLQLVLWARLPEARPDGAPAQACQGLRPAHGSQGSGNNSFIIRTNQATYTPGQPVLVTLLTERDQFQGFILQARREDTGAPVGTFLAPPIGTRLLDCSWGGDSLTHSDISFKSKVTIAWQPPDIDMGNLTVLGTVASNFSVWWSGLRTDVLQFLPSNDTKPLETTQTTSTDMTEGNRAWSGLSSSHYPCSVVIMGFLALRWKDG